MSRLLTLFAALLLVSFSSFAQQKSVLFDAAHAQTAGNADWTLDEDVCGTAQRYPTPDQSGITSTTAETYWNGGMSAFGVDLAKKGFHLESLPAGGRFSYGDATNAQDLSHYNAVVIPEPNTRFTAAEITALRSFVQNGGGLLMIADHAGSDRNNDGWDATAIFNELMGSPSIFGITYGSVSTDPNSWFDDHPDGLFTTDTTSPIIYTGTFGNPSSTRGLGLFGSTSMTLSTSANANVRGHIWRSTGTAGSSTLVTFATSIYGSGRIAAIGDSSPAEDGTNGCGHTTYVGYNETTYDNGLIFANAVSWITSGGAADTQNPTASVTSPSAGATVSGTVTINASASDNVGVTKMEIYIDGTLRTTNTNSGSISYSWNTTTFANSTHTIVAKAYDAAGNVGSSGNVSVTVNNSSGSTQLMGNLGFENGSTNPSPWTASSGVISNDTAEPANSGSWKAWLNGYGAVHTDTLQQNVTIPSTATSVTLKFYLHISTQETGSTAYDTLKVQLRNTSGTVLTTLATYSNANAAAGYSLKTFDVTSYKGQTVQVYLVGTEDASLLTSFVVDDFSMISQ